MINWKRNLSLCCVGMMCVCGFSQTANSGSVALQIVEKRMSITGETVICRGQEAHTEGPMLKVGTIAPNFVAADSEMKDVSLSDFKGKKVVLNIFPSLDTPTCAASVRHFNERASSVPQAVVLCISMDLPFAQSRFCSVEGLKNVVPLSVFRSTDFRSGYGLQLADGPLRGLLARAVIVLDEQGQIVYTELVKNVSEEPDYDAAMQALNQ